MNSKADPDILVEKRWHPARLVKFLSSILVLMLLLVAIVLYYGSARAAGTLKVEIITGYNLVVDSNVSSPSTYGPSVATVAGKFCNTGKADLHDVQGFIGDFGESTPGIYPVRHSTMFTTAHPALLNTGDYAFSHLGGALGAADATRYIGTLAPGECVYQYWHFVYPRCAYSEEPPCEAGAPTWGDSVKPEDDLWLTFDIWGSFAGGADVAVTRKMTMRNEISAMANKIEPNPNGYWINTKEDVIKPGEIITSNGILYEFGNINQGFDNDGDLVPDYNAWAQPVGDVAYDPSCFRLIRTSGVLTISRSAKPDMIIPFSDQLYFSNLPADNTGVVGNVHYTFMALDGPCVSAMTPYQEVASGYDNEKFNADYGLGIPPLESEGPAVTLDKTGGVSIAARGDVVTYTLSFTNAPDGVSAGLPSYNMPLVLSDSIPPSTTYQAGTAGYDVGAWAVNGVTILYSTDHAVSWSITEPITAGDVTNLQWWLNDPLPAGGSGEAMFAVEVDDPYAPVGGSSAYVENCGDARFDGAAPFAEACDTILISGDNSIGDYVWLDENGDGVQDASETGINSVTVSLYFDRNGDGLLDADDLYVDSVSTYFDLVRNGSYTFTTLPNGDYLVVVDEDDPEIPAGYRHTTETTVWVEGLGTTTASPYEDADFGFGPSLSINKVVPSGVLEGEEIEYNITVRNLRPGGGVSQGNYCVYTAWGSQKDEGHSEKVANKQWLYESNVYGEPDGVYAITELANANDTLAVTGFELSAQPGQIVSVTLAIYADEAFLPITGHILETSIWFTDANESALTPFAETEFDGIIGSQDVLTRDLTASHPRGAGGWQWDDFVNNLLDLVFVGNKGVGAGDLGLDAVALLVTSDAPCLVDDSDIIATAPLTDAITYNPDVLQFISAIPAESSVDIAAGVITWTNIGPLDPGDSTTIRATFLALEPPISLPVTSTNEACVNGATFSDGDLVNDACDTATTTITPTGSITGVVWSDSNLNGWDGITGYDAGDSRFPGVTAELYACYDYTEAAGGVLVTQENVEANKDCGAQNSNKGEWRLIATQVTDENGAYQFDGLLDAYYYVGISEATLPEATFTQTAEATFVANGSGFDCDSPETNNTCDSIWGDVDAVLLNVLNPINAAETITNVNFGYEMPAVLYGTIWQDHDGDGSREDGENGLDNGDAGITVTLWLNGSPYMTTTTDADGYYEFAGLSAGIYTITVATETLPPGGTWIQTADPGGTGSLDGQHTVTVAAREISGSHDFGYHHSGSYRIGDTVYADWNGDGDQDAGEAGIGGITLSLYEDSNGDGLIDVGSDALVTTTTNESGIYTFTDLVTGTYIVVVDESGLPAWEHYYQTQDPDEDPGVCSLCNGIGSATVSSTHTADLDVDFGYQPVGFSSIGDYVWYDADGDGIQDPDEVGLAGILIRLYVDDGDDDFEPNGDDALVNSMSTYMSTTTTIAGSYLFRDLAAGNYWVDVETGDPDLPTDGDGYAYILSTDNDPMSVTLPTGVFTDVYDFGFTTAGVIGDYVWQDNNNDGIQDAGEPGLVVVSVTLYSWTDRDGDRVYSAITDTIILSTTTSTDSSGLYRFAGLPEGDYVVQVVTSTLPAFATSATYDPDRLTVCSDSSRPSDPPCDASTGVSLSAGGTFLSADFGFRPDSVVGDYVWLDMNGNGLQDSGEYGIGGVVITLTQPGGGVVTTTTDSDGYYSFGGGDLPTDGDYTVSVYTSTLPNSTTLTPTVGADSNWTHSVIVTLTDGDITALDGEECTGCSLNADFGYRYDGNLSIGGHVFYDDEGLNDGTDDVYTATFDLPYSSITVYLWNSSETLIGTTSTDAGGQYTFTNLLGDAVYTVTVNANSPQLAGMDLTAVSTYELDSRHTVSVTSVSVTDVDYGFFKRMDFGDLPSNYRVTLLADEGPYHVISDTLHLGDDVTDEGDGQEDALAEGDVGDQGVSRDMLDPWQPGAVVDLNVTTTGGTGRLVAWFNWNGWEGDSDLNDIGEFIDFGEVSGNQPVSLTIPDTYTTGADLYVRFRLFDPTRLPGGSVDAGDYLGSVINGEVEDYLWTFSPTAVGLQSFDDHAAAGPGALVWFGLTGILVLAGLTVLAARRLRRVRVPIRRSE